MENKNRFTFSALDILFSRNFYSEQCLLSRHSLSNRLQILKKNEISLFQMRESLRRSFFWTDFLQLHDSKRWLKIFSWIQNYLRHMQTFLSRSKNLSHSDDTFNEYWILVLVLSLDKYLMQIVSSKVTRRVSIVEIRMQEKKTAKNIKRKKYFANFHRESCEIKISIM